MTCSTCCQLWPCFGDGENDEGAMEAVRQFQSSKASRFSTTRVCWFTDEWFVFEVADTTFSRLLVIRAAQMKMSILTMANSDNGSCISTGIADYHLHMTARM